VAELPPPATQPELREAERILGFALPLDVLAVYGAVANGGFGPGYGLVGIGGGAAGFARAGREWYCEHEYRSQRRPDLEARFDWPRRLLPVCDWGRGIYSCVDCSSADPVMSRVLLDAIADRDPTANAPEGYTFLAWLGAWADGVDLS